MRRGARLYQTSDVQHGGIERGYVQLVFCQSKNICLKCLIFGCCISASDNNRSRVRKQTFVSCRLLVKTCQDVMQYSLHNVLSNCRFFIVRKRNLDKATNVCVSSVLHVLRFAENRKPLTILIVCPGIVLRTAVKRLNKFDV